MGYYGFPKSVCLEHRTHVKHFRYWGSPRRCPKCGVEMVNIGSGKIPASNDDAGWEHLRWRIEENQRRWGTPEQRKQFLKWETLTKEQQEWLHKQEALRPDPRYGASLLEKIKKKFHE